MLGFFYSPFQLDTVVMQKLVRFGSFSDNLDVFLYMPLHPNTVERYDVFTWVST